MKDQFPLVSPTEALQILREAITFRVGDGDRHNLTPSIACPGWKNANPSTLNVCLSCRALAQTAPDRVREV